MIFFGHWWFHLISFHHISWFICKSHCVFGTVVFLVTLWNLTWRRSPLGLPGPPLTLHSPEVDVETSPPVDMFQSVSFPSLPSRFFKHCFTLPQKNTVISHNASNEFAQDSDLVPFKVMVAVLWDLSSQRGWTFCTELALWMVHIMFFISSSPYSTL